MKMKKQSSITKITRYLFYAILVLVFFSGCNEKQNPIDVKEFQLKQGYEMLERNSLQIMEMDSCEYLYAYTGGTSIIFTHRGICKYCTERAKTVAQKTENEHAEQK